MTKNEVELLQQLINRSTSDTSRLYDIYHAATSKQFDFNVYMINLKKALDMCYDFAILTEEANILRCSRRDVTIVLDVLATMLGNNIEELCDSDYIFTSPSRFEDYCKYSYEAEVLYTNRPVQAMIRHDGQLWRICDKYEENTPYYKVMCYRLEESI